ncbi:MAG: hypothetical protein AB7V27_11535 [Candidatus Binatia bacterium]
MPCTGDCNDTSTVTVEELILGVRIALGEVEVSNCPAFDRDGSGMVTIDDLLAAVSAALDGCPGAPSPTATATATESATPVDGTPTHTGQPTATHTVEPTATHTVEPTATNTGQPTATNTVEPTATNTGQPTGTATQEPTVTPTPEPTRTATETESPTPTGTPFGTPSNLTVTVVANEVQLAWTNPDPSGGYTSARLLRRLNAPVAGPEDPDATEIFFGSETSAVHPLDELLPDVPEQERTYHYEVFPCRDNGDCGIEGATATYVPSLAEVLLGGGYVIHWRHALANVCVDRTDFGTAEDPLVPDWWKSCESDCAVATARQLSDIGRQQAIGIGDAFKILGFDVSRVVSSEFCRNFTTAELMDFGPTIELDPAITYFVYDEPNRCDASYDLLAQVPEPGTNTALIGHMGFPAPCPVLGSLESAHAAVFKPDDAGGTAFITVVSPDEWQDLLPLGPRDLTASREQTHIRLMWDNGPELPRYRLLRRLGHQVDGAYDPEATVVAAGQGDTVLDPLVFLLPPAGQTRTYHYAVFGCTDTPDGACENRGSKTAITLE